MALVLLLASSGLLSALEGGTSEAIPPRCYVPIEDGWRIRIPTEAETANPEAGAHIGAVADNPRLHRRPLYPPADKAMVWSAEERAKLERCGFRPLVLAYNEPRFLFDYHSAGGLLGHLFLGLVADGESAWFHQWSDIDVSYIDGRMEYTLRDARFPGVTVGVAAAALSEAAGLIVRITVDGAGDDASLVWAYGGASAFFTNYAMTAPDFTYAPEHCAKDRVAWTGEHFTLRRAFDESDAYMKEVFAAARYLENWEAAILMGGTHEGRSGFGAPEAFPVSPAQLAASAAWTSEPAERRNVVAVYTARLDAGHNESYVAVGMGGNIQEALRHPRSAWDKALARNRGIAGRIVTHTPDPYLDAAVTMMAFATDGTWGDLAILHGAWSWRFAYLGWRGWYGPTCYGWTDRIRQSIQRHTTLGLVREGPDAGALGALLEHPPGVYYNMNEVFIDQVRQYFEYTNDLDLMQSLFPILEGIVAWENRRLQPGNEHLYENSLNTWISDSHWYIGGQCTQASAYMLRAHSFLADLAERLGKDGAPYREKAERIRAALQEHLWMPDQGVFAEYRDTRGHRLLHPEPELPTLYHAAEFGAADPAQIARMLDWAKDHLRAETTPYGGTLVWSSNWFPNRGRSYTHSTYEMAYAEELNFALTHYLAGRANDAYALLRATLCGVFNGPTPGGLACHAYADGRQRANDEFADAISMWGRTVTEGLFGIVPKRPDGCVELTPQFPADWPEASISTPHFAYQWRREGDTVSVDWTSPLETVVRLRIPTSDTEAGEVLVGGDASAGRVEQGPGEIHWLQIETPRGTRGTICVRCSPPPQERAAKATVEPSVTRVYSPPTDPGSRDLAPWSLIDLGATFNASVTDVLQQVFDAAEAPAPPAGQVGFGYWKSHLLGYHGIRNEAISDSAWRAKVGEDSVAWTTDGIPFKTAKTGPNIAVATLAGAFPAMIEFPVNAAGTTLYLLVSGMTFPVQSHVVNLRVTLRYADGDEQETNLVNPFDIGDCWSTWCGRFHDTAANGFENIGGRTGPAGSGEVADLTQPIAVDTEAHLVPFALRPGVPLAAVRIEAVANDAIFGVMGASIQKH